MAKQPVKKPLNADRELDLTLAQLDRLSNFYPRVEAKAAFMLGFNAGLIALAVSNLDLQGAYRHSTHGAMAVFSILVALSYIELAVTLLPHLRSPVQKSYTYFGDIAERPCAEFLASWSALSTEDRIRDATIQVWKNSEILASKFRACDRAIKLTILGLVPWLILLASPLAANQLKLG